MAFSLAAGDRDRQIVIQRATPSTDAFGGETPQENDWIDYTTAWASVSFGTGQERRQAAEKSGSAPATFRMLWNTLTSTVTDADRIWFMNAAWDISSVAPLGLNEGLDITATRAA